MLDARGVRFALEAVFLLAVAGLLAAAGLQPVWIVLTMLLAWALVALLEWTIWRERPHWSAGRLPRYRVPEQPLPPRPPSTELPAFTSYPRPAPREVEAPTWIATPELREQALGWVGEDEEPQTTVEELPEELLGETDDPDGDADGWPEPPHDEPGDPSEPEPAAGPTVRHRIDPFDDGHVRRWPWSRRAAESAAVSDLPPLPRHARAARSGEEG